MMGEMTRRWWMGVMPCDGDRVHIRSPGETGDADHVPTKQIETPFRLFTTVCYSVKDN